MKITKEQFEILKKSKVFLATPCYGGMVHERFMRGVIDLVTCFSSNKIEHVIQTISNESLITRGRNSLTKMFMDSDCTHLFFVDADVGFTKNDIIKLIISDRDVAVGSYPMKSINWKRIEQAVEKGEKETLRKYAPRNVVNFKAVDGKIAVKNGMIEVLDAGTGFMCIKKEAMEKMINSYPETQYRSDLNISKGEIHHAIFDCIIEEGTKRYLSEDYTFCRRWQKIGGSIWLDPTIKLIHHGTYAFEGANPMDEYGLKVVPNK